MRFQLYLVEALEQRTLLTALPAGFTEVQVATGLSTPTAMAFTPDGRLFITQQSGEIRVLKNGQLLGQNFADVDTNFYGERGLLGIAIDPTFGQPGGDSYIYVYYTANDGPFIRNRVSRFSASGDVAAGSEEVLIDLPRLGTNDLGPIWHMGGAMHFGPDGKLYVSQGDATVPNSAQSLGSLQGKILRFNRDGSIPSDNPFYDSLTGIRRSIWATGLRNPFTTAFQPGTGRFFLNDVGQDTWEEINDGVAGANYGWPITEGDFDPGEYPDFSRPLNFYDHTQGSCIVGGAFYNPSQTYSFPAQYHGQYFFGDFTGGFIKTLDSETGAVTPFATGTIWMTGLTLAPNGSIYYMSRGTVDGSPNAGSLYNVQYAPSQAPTITQQPQSQLVAVDESATFSVAVIGDAPFEFQWQRNGVDIDGANRASYTIENASFADNGAGFRVIVTNNFGQATSFAGTLSVANTTRPIPTLIFPVAAANYSGGETIYYEGTGIDEQDGVLPPSAFTWRVDLHHDDHVHPFMPPTSGASSGTFDVPASGHTEPNVWYRVHVTVRDSHGLTGSTYRDVQPRHATVQFQTNFPGLSIFLDGQTREAPIEVLGVQGITRLLEAPADQIVGGTTYQFVGWSDGGSRQHEISFPSANTVYSAYYRALKASASPLILAGNEANDHWILRLSEDRTSLVIFRNPPNIGLTSTSVALDEIDSIVVDGAEGDDSLTLDAVNGAFDNVGPILFTGGQNGTALGDTLRILGTDGDDQLDLTESGLYFGASPLTLAGVENIRIDLSLGDDVTRVHATPAAKLQLIDNPGTNTLDVFGGSHVIAADLNGLRVGVHNDAAVTFTSSQHLTSLELTGESRVALMDHGLLMIRTAALMIDTHARLDLNDNDLLLDYTGDSQLATIETLINTARAGGAWTGNGITSTAARDAVPKNRTLGAMSSADYRSVYGPAATFSGEAIDDTAVLVKFTYYGDGDFNGVVNFDDYSRIDAAFHTGRTGWLNGDFDLNNSTNFDDYSLIDLAFNTQVNSPPPPPSRGLVWVRSEGKARA